MSDSLEVFVLSAWVHAWTASESSKGETNGVPAEDGPQKDQPWRSSIQRLSLCDLSMGASRECFVKPTVACFIVAAVPLTLPIRFEPVRWTFELPLPDCAITLCL